MAHHLTLGAAALDPDGVRVAVFKARCSCGWTGPDQPFTSEAFTDAKIHAAIHDAALPEVPKL